MRCRSAEVVEMAEEDLEDTRRTKLQKKYAEMQKAQELERQIKAVLRSVLEPEAYERIMNVKIASQQKYLQVASTLIQLHNAKRIQAKITDEQLVGLLAQISETKDTSITIHRK